MLGVHAAAVTLALVAAVVVTAEQPQVLEKKTEQVLFVQQKPAPGATAAAAAGSEALPFASIHEARDHIRVLRRRALRLARFRVAIGPGVYPPLHLEPEDSGSADAPVIYEGRQGASLSAGVHVPPSAFKKWDGHPNVVQADLSSLGLTYGEMGAGGDNGGTCTQFTKARLFFENRTQILARWPNVQSFDPSTYQWQKIGVGGADGFTINDTATVARASKWAAEAAPWVHIYGQYDWSDIWAPVNISVGSDHATITGTGAIKVGQAKFYAANLLSELDAPHEYWIDEAKHTLYFYPPVPLEQWTEGVFISQNMTAANVTADHITLRNIGIRHSRGTGVVGMNVTGLRVENCDISGHGQHGVAIVGNKSGVDSSRVYSVGCSGVRVSGGVARTLTAGKSFVTANNISDFALHKRTYNPGVFWNGIGNNYSYNTVTNSPHNCFLGGGNEGVPWGQAPKSGDGSDCLFEGNTLDTCVTECGDCGAFCEPCTCLLCPRQYESVIDASGLRTDTCGQQQMAYVNRGNKLTHATFKNIGSNAVCKVLTALLPMFSCRQDLNVIMSSRS